MLTIFDIKDLHDVIYKHSTKDGKAREAMALVRHEVVRCLNKGIKTDVVLSYGDIMFNVAARTTHMVSERDEALLKLTITAIHDGAKREKSGFDARMENSAKKLNIA